MKTKSLACKIVRLTAYVAAPVYVVLKIFVVDKPVLSWGEFAVAAILIVQFVAAASWDIEGR